LDVAQRQTGGKNGFVVMWVCPSSHCNFNSPERQEECPKCGIIVRKLFQRDVREGVEEEQLLLKYQITPGEFAEWMQGVPGDCLAEREIALLGVNPADPSTAQAPRSLTAHGGIQPRPGTGTNRPRDRGLMIVGAVLLGLAAGLLFLHRTGDEPAGRDTSGTIEEQTHVAPEPAPPVIIPEPVEYRRTYPGRAIQQADEIAKQYKRTHTYSIQDMFVCVEMSMDVWNQLITNQIKAYLRAGNPEMDLRTYEKYSPEYYRHINHVWVMFQTEDGEHLPLETTGGYVVRKSHPKYLNYMEGIDFENPKKLKAHVETKARMADACKEAQRIAKEFNAVHAGKRHTPQTLVEKGKADQKIQDCKRLTSEFEASMR